MLKHIYGTLAVAAITLASFNNLQAQAYKADLSKSNLTWVGKKVTGEHTGSINLSSGSFTLKGKELTAGAFDIDMNTITCKDLTDPEWNGKLVGHLKSEDFFNVAKFPKASFVLTNAKTTGEGTYDVTGNLTIKGITKEVKFPATVVTTGSTATATANVVVDRTLYDIRYGSKSFFDNLGDKTIDNNFNLAVKLVATK